MMKNIYIVVLFILFSIVACKKEKTIVEPPDPEITEADSAALTSVKLEAKNNSGKLDADIICTVTKDTITALIPSIQNDKKLVVTFTTKTVGTKVTVNDTIQVSSETVTDFAKPVNYSVKTPEGKTRNYVFIIKNFTGIPILYLTTSGPVISKDNYVTGSVVINANNEFEQEKLTIPLQIKGRGNSTWQWPKKPYRMKFDSKAPMLGMPAAKNWVLLANYADKTLIRTSVAFSLGKDIGADFTPQYRFVDLVMNGQYQGTYLLTSQVEVHENRVNIKELDPDDLSADKITGGYLLEVDFRLDEDFWFRTAHDLPITIKEPEDIPQAQYDYIKNYMQQTEDAIFADNFADPVNGYAKYINVESFINWYIVEELCRNIDSQDQSSIYYYKDRNGKLGMGPVWDFDISLGNAAVPASGWYPKDSKWFKRLFEDPAFAAKVKARWNEIKGTERTALERTIDKNAGYLQLSQQKNFELWPLLNTDTGPIPSYGSYADEVNYLKTWLMQRFAWMDTEINKY